MHARTMSLGLLLIALGLGACQEASTPLPGEPELKAGNPPVTVMTRNLYVGADLDAVIAALASPDPDDDLPALGAAIATLQVTDFPTRAAAIAAEIAASRPVAVGLQEVSTLTLPTPAGMITIDFWPILEAALAARGLDYVVAAVVTNFDLQIPLGPGVAAGLVDRELLLVARGTQVLATSSGVYAAGLPLGFATLRRGWVRADLRIAGHTVSVVSTHLESGATAGPSGAVRRAQAEELMSFLPASTPVILMGDLNDVPGSPMYQVMTAAGFLDVWAAAGTGAGATCCHAADLSNPAGGLGQRIDYILVRGGFTTGSGQLVGSARVEVIGDEDADRVAGPAGLIWPSDHAGVVASLPPAR